LIQSLDIIREMSCSNKLVFSMHWIVENVWYFF
jgi:hypothetical protein